MPACWVFFGLETVPGLSAAPGVPANTPASGKTTTAGPGGQGGWQTAPGQPGTVLLIFKLADV